MEGIHACTRPSNTKQLENNNHTKKGSNGLGEVSKEFVFFKEKEVRRFAVGQGNLITKSQEMSGKFDPWLSFPNGSCICSVVIMGEYDGVCWSLMEYVVREKLRHIRKKSVKSPGILSNL